MIEIEAGAIGFVCEANDAMPGIGIDPGARWLVGGEE